MGRLSSDRYIGFGQAQKSLNKDDGFWEQRLQHAFIHQARTLDDLHCLTDRGRSLPMSQLKIQDKPHPDRLGEILKEGNHTMGFYWKPITWRLYKVFLGDSRDLLGKKNLPFPITDVFYDGIGMGYVKFLIGEVFQIASIGIDEREDAVILRQPRARQVGNGYSNFVLLKKIRWNNFPICIRAAYINDVNVPMLDEHLSYHVQQGRYALCSKTRP